MSNSKGDKVRRTHYTSQLNKSLLGARVKLIGWIEDSRALGGITFLTIRDVMGKAQTVFSKSKTSIEVFELVKKIPRQSVIMVEGVVKESKAKDFEVEVEGDKIEVLAEAAHPLPIDPTGRVKASLDIRLDARALDLRNPSTMAIFKIRHHALQSIRKTFIEKGFIEVNTSRIIGQAAEGGANLFSLDYFGRPAYLAQSPQLYKEQLTLSLERVFEISNFFRAEKSHTRKHLNEFISIDIEAAYCDEEDVMDIAEDVIINVFKDVSEQCKRELEILNYNLPKVTKPFERITYSQAIEELRGEGVDVKVGDDLTDSLLRILGKKRNKFYFITEWPKKLKPFYIKVKEDNPEFTHSFDLQYGYLEIASGGMRVWKKEELKERLIESNLDPESFSSHLKVFDWGMPFHSGWGMGLDRLMMVLTGRKNIREVVLYPRDQFRLTP
ncbi:MAG: aspartate--tRNA(Asn) ligase [Nitrososphaerales archaeon]|nr:aspartate--tRNA(Asn) ligase [Nitrososphaerales archaeon]